MQQQKKMEIGEENTLRKNSDLSPAPKTQTNRDRLTVCLRWSSSRIRNVTAGEEDASGGEAAPDDCCCRVAPASDDGRQRPSFSELCLKYVNKLKNSSLNLLNFIMWLIILKIGVC